MAEIKSIAQAVGLLVWGPFSEKDVLIPAGGIGEYKQRSVQVVGDFGTGGTVVIGGSNDPHSALDDFDILRDSFGVPLEFTVRDLRQIEEAAAAYVPKITAGSGLSLTVRIFAV